MNSTRPATGTGSSAELVGDERPALLLYGMYDIRGLDRAPKVRISMMAAALERHVKLERIVGGRSYRAVEGLRWLLRGRWRRIGAVYVESSTSTATPADLVFLTAMRLMRRPVGVYFRDAYQLFRDIYPISRRRQRLSDVIWRLTMPLMRRLATHRFAPSRGLAEVLSLRECVLLPPGTDPDAPDLGAGSSRLAAYVGSADWADGFDLLIAAMTVVRRQIPGARLRVISRPLPAARLAKLPAWVEVRRAGRDQVAELLREARVCVIPRPITPYTDLAVPLKLWDYLSFGKPIVATATRETKELVEASGAGIVTDDTAEGLAEGIVTVLSDDEIARRFARNSHAFATSPEASWDARARTVIRSLGMGPQA